MPSLARDSSVRDTRELYGEPSSLALTLAGLLRPFLQEPQITEICINRPGSVFLETNIGWQCETLPELDLDWCSRFAKLVANYTRQRVDATSPLLSGSLPGGERVQLVLPPPPAPAASPSAFDDPPHNCGHSRSWPSVGYSAAHVDPTPAWAAPRPSCCACQRKQV